MDVIMEHLVAPPPTGESGKGKGGKGGKGGLPVQLMGLNQGMVTATCHAMP